MSVVRLAAAGLSFIVWFLCCSHDAETTHWNHPEMTGIIRALGMLGYCHVLCMPLSFSLCVCLYLSVRLSVCLCVSVYFCLCLSASVSVCLSICLSVLFLCEYHSVK